MSKVKTESETAESPSPASPRTVRIDESRLTTGYANLFRVLGTPDELIVDAGFQALLGPTPPSVISLSQRLIINWPAAKRLLQTLQAAVEAHERGVAQRRSA